MRKFFRHAKFFFGGALAQDGGLGDSSFKSVMEALNKSSGDICVMIIRSSRLSLGAQHINYFSLVKSRISNYLQEYSPVVYSSLQGDIIVVAHKMPNKIVGSVEKKVRQFFAEDVFCGGEVSDDNQEFLKTYTLPNDKKNMLQDIASISKEEQEIATPDILDKFLHTDKRYREITTDIMSEIENYVEHLNISQYTSSQSICSSNSSKNVNDFKVTGRELYISVDKLQDDLSTSINIISNPWLFIQLTNCFDIKLLHHLQDQTSTTENGHLNINLNIKSIFSNVFNNFINTLSNDERTNINIELQKVDIFNDIGAYFMAKEIIHENGMKVIIDALTPITMKYLDWERLSPDGIKIYWDQRLLNDEGKDVLKNIKKFKEKGGQIILAHCDTPESIEWGRKNGIELLQGWEVDKHLMPGYTEQK